MRSSSRYNRFERRLVPLTAAFVLCACAVTARAATGFYRVATTNGVSWFVRPDGTRFFSLGVDCVLPGDDKREYKPSNPAYAWFKNYPTKSAWAKASLARLKSWGFNTLGGWSDVGTLSAVPGETMPYTIVLHLGAYVKAPWSDLFDPKMPGKFDELCKKLVVPYANDPRLLGWFTDNELGWWDDTLFTYFLGAKDMSHSHRALMDLLRTRYHGSFAELRRDFDTGSATTFEALNKNPRLTLRPGAHGIEAVKAFVSAFATRYNQLVFNSIRKVDRNHLILGQRYAQYASPEVVRASIPYVDVVSTNYGADWTDGGNARFYLDMLHEVTHKPVMVTEFYFCAMENRSGNKNTSDGFPTVKTQAERAAGFAADLRDLASRPYLVGAHWFQYTDEPTNGRGDGENYDMGLVDINDQPYAMLTGAAERSDCNGVHAKPERAIAHGTIPVANMRPLDGLKGWNRAASFISPSNNEPVADLYACHDDKNLYLAVVAQDYFDSKLYPNGKIPEDERMTLTFHFANSADDEATRLVKVIFGPGGKPTAVPNQLELATFNASVRSTAIVAIPAQLTGYRSVIINAVLYTHSGAQVVRWNVDERVEASR